MGHFPRPSQNFTQNIISLDLHHLSSLSELSSRQRIFPRLALCVQPAEILKLDCVVLSVFDPVDILL